MPCSLQIYRARIGTFLPKYFRKSSIIPRTPSSSMTAPLSLIIVMTLYCCLVLHVDIRSTSRIENNISSVTIENDIIENFVGKPSLANTQWNPGLTKLLVGKRQTLELLESVSNTIHPWNDHKEMNKLMHIISRNMERRGRGINCIYWNKGPTYLVNKQMDIKTIVQDLKPQPGRS